MLETEENRDCNTFNYPSLHEFCYLHAVTTWNMLGLQGRLLIVASVVRKKSFVRIVYTPQYS